jgi:hypothetical protein
MILLSVQHDVTWLPKFLTCRRFPWEALCGARGGALDVGAESPLVAEAAGDLWLMSADGAAMAGRAVVEVG